MNTQKTHRESRAPWVLLCASFAALGCAPREWTSPRLQDPAFCVLVDELAAAPGGGTVGSAASDPGGGGRIAPAASTKRGSDVTIGPEVRLSYFSGYTEYEIEFDDIDGEQRSRLNFPIDNLRLDAGANLNIGDHFSFSLSGWSTLDEDAGTMRDDDYTNDVRVVWSRSDAELQAWGIEAKGVAWLLHEEGVTAGPTLQIVYDQLDYDIYDTVQRGIIIDDLDPNVSVSGKTLTYSQERFSIPLGVLARWRPLAWLEIEASGALSPLTYVWDEDEHLRRDLYIENDALAWTVQAALAADVIVADGVRLGVWGEIFYLDSWWAEQRQYHSAGTGVVDAEISRYHFLLGAKVAIDF